ncbi:unnamed protein product, partial [Didymodactylos carnosus]
MRGIHNFHNIIYRFL